MWLTLLYFTSYIAACLVLLAIILVAIRRETEMETTQIYVLVATAAAGVMESAWVFTEHRDAVIKAWHVVHNQGFLVGDDDVQIFLGFPGEELTPTLAGGDQDLLIAAKSPKAFMDLGG